MSQLDLFVARLATSDTKSKLALGGEIVTYLQSPDADISCEDMASLVDSITGWLNQSNFKVCLNGLDILGFLVERMKSDFRVHFNTVLPPALERLGDAKDSVREKVHVLLVKLMLFTTTPNAMLERISVATNGLAHKNAKVREELLVLLQGVLSDHGASSLQLSKLLPSIVKLLSDPSLPVRDAAFNTIVEIYKHVGERVRADLQKKYNVPPARLAALLETFDQVRDSGQMLVSVSAHSSEGSRRAGEDDVDRMAVSKSSRAGRAEHSSTSSSNTDDSFKRVPSLSRKTATTASAGAGSGGMDESLFIAAFEAVPKVNLFSARDLEAQMTKIRETIGHTANDWDKRVDALKRIRSVLIAGAVTYAELPQHLKLLEPALELSIRDLRSQVVREGCITVAYLSQQLAQKADHLCYVLLPALIELIPNCAKVMSTSGVVTVRFIIQHTHYGRLVSLIVAPLTTSISKSREIRRACCEFVEQLVVAWPAGVLDRHVPVVQEAVRRGLQDADAEVRSISRRAYWAFAEQFRDAADSILNSLDASHKKMLVGEMSKSSSSNSLSAMPRGGGGTAASRSRASSRAGSHENLLNRAGTAASASSSHARRIIQQQHTHNTPSRLHRAAASPVVTSSPASARSTSAIDLQAAQRARARAQYATAQRMRAGAQLSLQQQPCTNTVDSRPRRQVPAVVTPSRLPPPTGQPSASPALAINNSSHNQPLSPQQHAIVPLAGRTPRHRSRVTQSQPGSRSGSPSSRFNYASSSYTSVTDGGVSRGSETRRRRPSSGIPRSTTTSREPSPQRQGNGAARVSRQNSLNNQRDVTSSPHARTMAAHRILLQSREAESVLNDALSTNRSHVQSGRHFDDRSDDSENSSVCSDLSYDAFSRRDYMSWHGGMAVQHTPPGHSSLPPLSGRRSLTDTDRHGAAASDQEVSEVIASIASTQWSERKEGLLSLQSVLLSNRMLSGSELKRLTDTFTKMFMDTHTKVFSIFVDTLQELIVQHHQDLGEWLYTLTTRLLNKLGADLLGSVVHKINRTLQLVRERFSVAEQMRCTCRFMLDQTQTPNAKVRAAMLLHLRALLDSMQPGDFVTDLDTPLAVAKVISWTSDQKSVEVRNSAKSVIVSMFNVNTAEFTSVLGQLSKLYQDTVYEIVQQHLRRRASVERSTASLLHRSRSPGSPMMPSNNGSVSSSPRGSLTAAVVGSLPRSGPRSLMSASQRDDAENLNPDELYRSLRRTTAEIQNYSFDTADRPQQQQQSSLKKNSSNDPLPASTSSAGTGQLTSCLERLSLNDPAAASTCDNPRTSECGQETFASVLADLNIESAHQPGSNGDDKQEYESRQQSKRAALQCVSRLARHAPAYLWHQHFRALLRCVLDQLGDVTGAGGGGGTTQQSSNSISVREACLSSLSDMLRRDCVAPLFQPFAELLFLRVLDTQRDKDLCRAGEQCAAVAAVTLPPDTVVRVLNPLVQRSEFPVDQAAIKTLTRLVEHSSADTVVSYLPSIMPSLLKAYDNDQSSVRKAAVFCMVTIYTLCGEAELRPHLASLNATKMKLLNLYIKRAQQTSTPSSTTPTTPK